MAGLPPAMLINVTNVFNSFLLFNLTHIGRNVTLLHLIPYNLLIIIIIKSMFRPE